ncbi:hypothetical protein G7Y89_g12567 [Cudoniella acicularis]|uniref:Major facilitator superfamily (MFS) profile domain-containing protein n=1 Tax=Cudoniella acicularis TaxID=354080 RepID=A0A8H4R9U5_9HELO|nr:hypothetical protein G7Y89_g12567 [Cudoniella acicularis]
MSFLDDWFASIYSSLSILLRVRSEKCFVVFVVAFAVFTTVEAYSGHEVVPILPTILRERIAVDEQDSEHDSSHIASTGVFAQTHTVQIWNSILIGAYGGAMLVASSAAIYTAGIALLFDTVGHEGICQALGWLSPAMVLGSFLGPSIGGLLYSSVGTSAVFGLCYSLITLEICLLLIVEKTSTSPPLLFEADLHNNYGTIADAEVFTIDSESEFEFLANSPKPEILLLQLLPLPRFLIALLGWLAITTLLTAFDAILPLFVQKNFGWSTIGSGLIFPPLFLPSLLVTPISVWTINTLPKSSCLVATVGFLFSAPIFIFLTLVSDNSLYSQILLVVLLALIGVGLSISGPPLAKEIAGIVFDIEEEYPGVFGERGASVWVFGLFGSMFALGSSLGPIVAGVVRAMFGWEMMAWALGVVCVIVGIGVGIMGFRGRVGEESGGVE